MRLLSPAGRRGWERGLSGGEVLERGVLQLSDQRLGRCGIAHLGARDEVEENVARLGPRLGALGPLVELGGLVPRLDGLLRAHQSSVGEAGGGLVDLREVLVMSIDDGNAVLARQLVEARILETVVADFQGMARRQLAGPARQERLESLA